MATVVAPVQSERLAKFTGEDFKRWQQKMLFYLTTLGLVCFLKEDAPIVEETDNDTQ
ncbi:hypothetical protein C2S52_011806 [Perilla frutescens var. hirtella]|nr:hypothetical protein C2S52_011806 [Perilla frutescens var. hirtella]